MTPFRDQRGASASKQLVYGPFVVPWPLVALPFLCFFAASIIASIGSQSDRFICGAGDVCTLNHEQFPRVMLRDARVDDGVLVITLSDGTERRLHRVRPERAANAQATITSAMRAHTMFDVELSTKPFDSLALQIRFGAWIAALIAIFFSGRVRLRISDDRRTLLAQRRVLGMTIHAREVSLDGAYDVSVERFREARVVGRLCLDYRDGKQVSLTRGYFIGDAVHDRAAARLRAVLGLAPNVGDDATLAAARPVSLRRRAAIASAVGLGGGVLFADVTWRSLNDLSAAIEWALVGVAIAAALAVVGTRHELPR